MTSYASILYPDSAAPPPAPAPAPAASPAPSPAAIAAPPPAPAPAPAVQATAASPSPTPAPAPADSPAPAAPSDAPALTADAIAASVPEDIRQQRAEATRRLYGTDDALAEALPDDEFATDGLAPEVQVAMAHEIRAIAGDIGLNVDDVDAIRSVIRDTPPSDEQRVANREQIVDSLNARYGDGAYQAWIDARKFVALDPRRAALLAPAGDDPKTVLRLVELAQAAKRAGRLR